MSNACTSFHALNRQKQMHGSLADYCRDVSESIGALSVDSQMCEASDIEGSEVAEDDSCVAVQQPQCGRYNKREAFFTEDVLKKLRRNRRLNHQITKTKEGKQQSCVWCCRAKEHTEGAKHSRLGQKTTKACSVCSVPLCSVVRYDSESCFQQWHSAVVLNNPCAPDAPAPSVQINDRRAPPPSRRRSDGDVPLNPRSRVPRIQVQQERNVRPRRR